MMVFLGLALGILVAVESQVLAQGLGFSGELAEGLRRGQEHQLLHQKIQLQEEPSPEQLRQMELDNRLRTLKMEIDKRNRQRALSDSAAHSDQEIPQLLETPVGDKPNSYGEPLTCATESAGQAFLECLDRIAPKR